MRLYCVRHGEAESSEVDSERPLTKQGKNDITKMANYLSQCGVRVSTVLHSPKLRAKQTAEILGNGLSATEITQSQNLLNEDAAVEPLEQMVKSLQEDVMLVGHLPFMYHFVNKLLLNNENYYPIINFFPGTIVCLDYEDQQWMINWIISPKIIPDAYLST